MFKEDNNISLRASQVKKITDPSAVYKTFFNPGEITEVRVLGLYGKNKAWEGYARNTIYGYFNNPDAFCKAIKSLEEQKAEEQKASGVYFTFNPSNPALIARAQNRLKAADSKSSLTTDKDIIKVRWLAIDLDPVRPSGVSSTDDELNRALKMQKTIAKWLEEEFGIIPGIFAMSGNGAHLLVRIEDSKSEIASPIIKDALKAIAHVYPSTDTGVEVDQSVYNPARIWKAYGTTARKGDSTKDRPHRMAYILDTGITKLDDIPVNSLDKIRRLIEILPKTEAITKKTQNKDNRLKSGILDVPAYLKHYGVEVVKKKPTSDGNGIIYCLKHCVFDPNHTPNESSIIQFNDGSLAYQCFHNSCKNKTWQDARKAISGDDSLRPFMIDNKTGEIIKEVNKNLLDNLSNIIFDEENRRIYKIKFDKNGNKIEELLENFVILPKGILVNIFTGEIEKFKIEIKANNKALSREVALDKITTQKLEDLSLPPKNLKLITTELNRRFLNDSSIETSRCSDTIGWIDNENFIHPILTKDIDWFIMDDEHNQYAKFNPNITPEEAKQAIRTITHKLISAPYPVIVPLLFAIQTIHNPENRFLCEITGTTSTGKSKLLETIAYLLGWKPKGWNATYNYLVRYISSFQNYPTFLDEIHLANPKTSVDIVYMLTQGEDKGRLKRSGEAKKQKSFNTSLVSTGEKSIIDNIEQLSNDITPYGTIARTLTITVDKPIFSQKECIELLNLSKKSAGWLLKLWIKEHTKKDIFKEVFEKTDSILEEENIQYHCLTIFPPMSWVLDELYRMDLVTDEDYAVAKQQLQEYKKTLLNTTKEEIEINNEEKIRIMIEDYLIENKDHFENIEGDPNFRGERWGWVSEETDGLTFRVLGKPFYQILKNLHLPQRLKKSGHRPDWIDYGERWIKAVNNKRRVYIISLKKTEEKGKETQDNTTSEEFSISELVDTTPANEELANLI